jgi:hypothetical protein
MQEDTSNRPLFGRLALSLLLALALWLPSYGQNGSRDNDPHATGYRPPTPEQKQLMRQTRPRIVKVWPNRLAWIRVNEERKKKGMGPLPERGFVPKGAEKDFTVGNGPVISAVPQGFVALTDAPGYVDNSLKDAFPPIRTQGSIGSCTNWAVTYYQLTYTAGRDYGYNNKNVDNDWKFSPKWTYNMINGGEDRGSWPGDAYAVLERHGAARWCLFPYQTNGADPKSYREWCRDGETWRDAIGYRIEPFEHLDPPVRTTGQDFTEWLDTIKGLLDDGEVLTFATYITGWQYTTLQDDESTPYDDAFVRKPVAYWVGGYPTRANHMMTIVGYNDNVWTDINNNSTVEPEEKGALRIANSWGADWQDSGLCWLAYDALRSESAAGGPSAGRQPAITMDDSIYSIRMLSATPVYHPTLVAKFKLVHAKRNQLCVALALATSDGQETLTTWIPGALQFQGGAYAFDGTRTACEGTFVFDFTDVLSYGSGSDLYQLHILDSTRRSPAELLGYELIDRDGLVSGGFLSSAVTFDNDMMTVGLPYPSDAEDTGPVAVATASPISGRAPLRVTFDGSGSTGDLISYVWDFGDGSALGEGAVVTHTYSAAGTYTATLIVADQGWSESSQEVVVTVTGKGKKG